MFEGLEFLSDNDFLKVCMAQRVLERKRKLAQEMDKQKEEVPKGFEEYMEEALGEGDKY